MTQPTPDPATGTTPPTNEHFEIVPAARPEVPDGECLRCGSPIESLGIHDFRTGGTTGGWKLLVGEFAELGEDMFPLEVRACRTCGHVELRLARQGG
jgi:hypothetical protein